MTNGHPADPEDMAIEGSGPYCTGRRPKRSQGTFTYPVRWPRVQARSGFPGNPTGCAGIAGLAFPKSPPDRSVNEPASDVGPTARDEVAVG